MIAAVTSSSSAPLIKKSTVEEASSSIVIVGLGVTLLRWASSSSSETASEKPKKKVTDHLSGVIDAVNDRKLPPELRGKRNSVRRGISTFYSGKSKSFTSLADATSCSSIKDIVKPEDAYTRKRKNLLAHSIFWDKNRNHNPKSNNGGISKRLANSSRSSSNLAVMMSNSESNINSENSNSNSSSPSLCLPPLPPHGRRSRSPNNESPASPPTPRRNFSTWRSFSLSDLQHAAATTTPNTTALVIDNRSAGEDSH